jgi:AAA15 family ATPase/GTPase
MIDHLHIQNFKGFRELKLESLARVNLITGRNNTGKTSVLEALMMLAFPRNQNPVFANRKDARLSENDKEGYRLDRQLSLFHNRDYQKKIQLNDHSFEIEGVTDQDIKQLYRGQDVNLVERRMFKHEPVGLDSIAFRMVHASGIDREALHHHWSNIALTGKEKYVEEAIRLIEPDFIKASILGRVGPERLHVQLKGKDHPYPIDRLGEGMNRLIGLVLALFNAEGGFLLIDELENGLHYSIQPKVWEYLFRFAQELDVQIFATTHSRDCIEAFAEVADREENKGQSHLIRLFKSKDGSIKDVELDEEEVQIAVENQIELR